VVVVSVLAIRGAPETDWNEVNSFLVAYVFVREVVDAVVVVDVVEALERALLNTVVKAP